MIIITHDFLASCNNGDLRLRGGKSNATGRLEMCYEKQWTTIHVDGWSSIDTKIACEQMEFSAEGVAQDVVIANMPFFFSYSQKLPFHNKSVDQ